MSDEIDREEGWDAVAFELEHLIESDFSPPEGLDQACETLLTRLIAERYPGQTGLGAKLAGVSAPTFRKRVRQL